MDLSIEVSKDTQMYRIPIRSITSEALYLCQFINRFYRIVEDLESMEGNYEYNNSRFCGTVIFNFISLIRPENELCERQRVGRIKF